MNIFDWKSIGSMIASIMFIQTMIRDFVPYEVKKAINGFISKIFSKLVPYFYPKESILIIDEDLDSGYSNELYGSVQTYLSSKCISFAESYKVSKPTNSKNLTFSMNSGQTFDENVHGFRVKWSFDVTQKKNDKNRVSTNRYFTVSFPPQYKEKVHSVYLPEIIKQAKTIEFNNEERQLYTNKRSESRRGWSSVPFTHPSTFKTLALNPILKEEIQNDLQTFVQQKEFYAQVGRTWKRGYLLYGPPGTGKTSLIAAIANFLQFDIYDLELKSVEDDSHLKKLLISTSRKSIIVMEDVDCSANLSNRKLKTDNDEEKKMTRGVSLSGVLNFVDGLWSSCGGERLIILTTNYKDNLDSALLRPGRMDKHIHLSYIDFSAFKMLAFNYLHIQDHMLMNEVEEILPLANVTAAEIAEVFMSSVTDADMAMKNATELVKNKSSMKMDSGKIVKLENQEDGIALVSAE